MSKVLWFAVGAYCGAGIWCGLMIAAAIPALNWIGVTYIAAIWPGMLYCAPVSRHCDVVPPLSVAQYLYTFEAPQ